MASTKHLFTILSLLIASVAHAQWVQQTSGSTTPLYGVFAVNADTVFVADDNGDILKTTNGGTNWSVNNSNGNATCWDVAFTTVDTGVVVGRDNAGSCNGGNRAMINRTFDGGDTWECDTLQLFNAQWIKTVHWASSTVGYAISENMSSFDGNIHKTTNQGLTWDTIVGPAFSGGSILDVFFVTEDIGWMVGTNGFIRKTVDGGLNWTSQNAGSNDINAIWMHDQNNGVLCGNGGLIRTTTNGGNTWQSQISLLTDYLDIYFVNSTDGYMCGQNGGIRQTTNGGNTWFGMTTPVNSYLYDINFFGGTGYCVGANGVILKLDGSCTGFTGSASVTSDYNGSDVSCPGDSDGEATAVPSGGQSPYTFSWSSGGSNAVEIGLSAGTYTITVTDDNGCTEVINVTVNDPTAISATMSEVSASCGQSNGSATATGAGGSGSLQYQWDANANNQQNATATGLAAGTYYVTLTDENACTHVDSITVTNPNAPVPSIQSSTNTTCFGDCDGDATATQTGGQSPFTYAWSSGGNTDTETGLCAGTYTITVTDANNCSASTTVTITEPAELTGTVSVNPETITCDGDATVSPAGGTSPYTYLWDDTNAQTDAQATGLCAGTYCVTVTDANGCTFDTCGISVAVGINEIPVQHSINVYPNPAKESFIISASKSGSFMLHNGVGQVVLTGRLNQTQQVSGLAKGFYTIAINIGEHYQYRKLIVE